MGNIPFYDNFATFFLLRKAHAVLIGFGWRSVPDFGNPRRLVTG